MVASNLFKQGMDSAKLNECPKVSVVILAYNNEPYIRAAILGVANQICNFLVEVLIGEDASLDNTYAEIEDALRESGLDNVQLFRRKNNLGMHANYDDLLRRARGTYVADLDGDDTWIDPYKLQKQVEFLDKNPHASLVFTKSQPVDANVLAFTGNPIYLRERQTLSFEDIFAACSIPHSTVLFRRELLPNLPDWVFILPNYDWSMFLVLAEKGSVCGLPDITATYTWHGQGSASGRTAIRHLVANCTHFVNHAKYFRQSITISIAVNSRSRFEDAVVSALDSCQTRKDIWICGKLYLRFCLALQITPKFLWIGRRVFGVLRQLRRQKHLQKIGR